MNAVTDTPFSAGQPFALKKTVVSNTIKAATATAILTASDDELIEQIIMETDGTGLAGGTNFSILNDNATGAATVLAQAISGLGVNANILGTSAGVTALKRFMLESGKHLLVQCSGVDCTGNGVITLVIYGRRMGPNANPALV